MVQRHAMSPEPRTGNQDDEDQSGNPTARIGHADSSVLGCRGEGVSLERYSGRTEKMHRFLAREPVFVVMLREGFSEMVPRSAERRPRMSTASDRDQEFRDAGKPDLSYEDLCRLAPGGRQHVESLIAWQISNSRAQRTHCWMLLRALGLDLDCADAGYFHCTF